MSSVFAIYFISAIFGEKSSWYEYSGIQLTILFEIFVRRSGYVDDCTNEITFDFLRTVQNLLDPAKMQINSLLKLYRSICLRMYLYKFQCQWGNMTWLPLNVCRLSLSLTTFKIHCWHIFLWTLLFTRLIEFCINYCTFGKWVNGKNYVEMNIKLLSIYRIAIIDDFHCGKRWD